jgi:hypothetical protein
VSGPRGSGEVKFDRKMASHEEVDRLRKEVQSGLNDLTRELAKLKMTRSPGFGGGGFQPRPGNWGAFPQPFPQPGMGYGNQNGGGMNPLMLMLMLQQGGSGGDLTSNPFGMLVLMQAMQGASIGSVGGQPINIDLTTIALLASTFGFLRPPAPPSRVPAPAPAPNP